MDNKENKYNINSSFFKRYLVENAEKNFLVKFQKFLFWRDGKFLNPQLKEKYYNEFLIEEIDNFYEKNELNIPQCEFVVTTRCSLKCKYCSNLMPLFDENTHSDLTFEDFKKDFDILTNNVNKIRKFSFIGGEPLINKELYKMLDYAASNEKIDLIEIISNGTIIPNKELIEVIKKYKKIYFYLSNYSVNKDIKILKYDEILKLLNSENIKYSFVKDLQWFKEDTLKERNYNEDQLKNVFKNCYSNTCISILNGEYHICPKSSSGKRLGIIEVNDYINLRNSKNLRKDLIDFYEKDYFDACRYCIRLNEKILPAEQL